MSVNGSFTTSTPLAANLQLAAIGPGGLNIVTSWRFFDGVSTFDQTNSVLIGARPEAFSVLTDANGNVSGEGIELVSPGAPHTIGQTVSALFIKRGTFLTRDYICTELENNVCTLFRPADAVSSTAESGGNGTWTVTNNVAAQSVPLGSARWTLLLAALLAAFVAIYARASARAP